MSDVAIDDGDDDDGGVTMMVARLAHTRTDDGAGGDGVVVVDSEKDVGLLGVESLSVSEDAQDSDASCR